MEEDQNIPIILGRPFLAIGRTLIDVQKGELTIRVDNDQITFNVFAAMKLTDEDQEEIYKVSVIEWDIAEFQMKQSQKDPLLSTLINEQENEDLEECTKVMGSFLIYRGKIF